MYLFKNEVQAVKVAVLAATHGMSAAPCGVLATLRGVLLTQDTHGKSRGLEGPSGRGGNIHEKIVWSKIA